MTTDALRVRIDNALAQAEFTDMYRRRLNAHLMRQLYEAKQNCVLGSTEAISVQQPELATLVSELDASLGSYKSPSGTVGNGLYLLTGTSGSPRLPSSEDYAKVFVLAAARIGSCRVTELFAGWLKGEPVRSRSCALLTGIETHEVLEPVAGMRLETLPLTPDDLDRKLLVDDYGIRRDRFARRAMLSIEYEIICPLYDPQSFRESFPADPLPSTLVNPALKSVSFDSFCRAMSLNINHFVDWSMQWQDYGEVEAFFLQASSSGLHKEYRSPLTMVVTKDDVRSCLDTHALLSQSSWLALPVARWRRAKRSPAIHEQLIELRIALESVLLHGDHEGEKSFRIAVRGAWLLGGTFKDRKSHFDALRSVYSSASTVIHGGTPKAKKGRDLGKDIATAQNLCRDAILRLARGKEMPDWSDMILGHGYIAE